jgi:hypothetical protein
MTVLRHCAGVYVIAVLCVVIAATMPPMEIVPFAATSAGAALTAFALSLLSHDGLVALIAIVFTCVSTGLVAYSFLK